MTHARDLGADVRVRASLGPEQAYPAFRLVRDAWGFDQAADPPASISLEWFRARTTLHGNAMPYVGLRAFKEQPVGVTVRASEAFRQARLGRKDVTSSWWPAYTFVRPTSDFPSSRDAYRDVLLEALRAAWIAYAPFVPVNQPP